MAISTTQHRASTRGTERRPAELDGSLTPATNPSARARGMVSFVAGATGVVAGTAPIPGVIALLLAALAIGLGVPSMRRGPRAASYSYARMGVVLGMIAALLGFLSLALQLLG